MSVEIINKENFNEKVLNQEGIVLVDFWAEWCSPCRMMLPIIEEFAGEQEQIKVCKVNVDDNPELASQYNVMSIPTFIIFKNGKEEKRLVGTQGKEDLEEAINI